MRLALRDHLAEWLLAALGNAKARKTLTALGAFLAGATSSGSAPLDRRAVERLLAEGEALFEAAPGGVCIRSDFVTDLPALRERSARFARVLDRVPNPIPIRRARQGEAPSIDEISTLLALSAVLLNESLYFEVHELLEPAWGRSTGSRKIFLQGIIQIAVGLNHHAARNLRGGAALLSEGSEKLAASADELQAFDLRSFCEQTGLLANEVHRQLHEGSWRPVVCPPLNPGRPTRGER